MWREHTLLALSLSHLLRIAYYLTLSTEFEYVLPLLLETVPVPLTSVLPQVWGGFELVIFSCCFAVYIYVQISSFFRRVWNKIPHPIECMGDRITVPILMTHMWHFLFSCNEFVFQCALIIHVCLFMDRAFACISCFRNVLIHCFVSLITVCHHYTLKNP